MNHKDIHSKIQAAATQLTEELLDIFSEAFSAVVSDLTPKASAKASSPKKAIAKRAVAAPKPKGKAPAKAAKPAKPGKRIRRSNQQLFDDAQRIVKLLSSNKKGLRIEQIKKTLAMPTKQLARPILKLLTEGKIKKSGEKRATTYFPV